MAIALMVIDDHRRLREGLAALLHGQPDIDVLAGGADVEEAVRLVQQRAPDVVLLDFALEAHDALQLTATVHAGAPEAKVIVTGLQPQQDDVADFVRAGASGFIMRDASVEACLETIRDVAAGEPVLPRALAAALFAQIAGDAPGGTNTRALDEAALTGRERQIIALLGEGLSNKAIALRLHIAVHTVKTHVHNVLGKLALRTRLEVAAFTQGNARWRMQ